MLGQYVAIAAAQPRQQPRRTLDVAEQEGDGPTRKLRHAAQLRRITGECQVVPGSPPAPRPSRRDLRRPRSIAPETNRVVAIAIAACNSSRAAVGMMDAAPI